MAHEGVELMEWLADGDLGDGQLKNVDDQGQQQLTVTLPQRHLPLVTIVKCTESAIRGNRQQMTMPQGRDLE